MERYPRIWEPVNPTKVPGTFDLTYRLKVYGGWLVQDVNGEDGITMVYVPDPDHRWILEDMPSATE